MAKMIKRSETLQAQVYDYLREQILLGRFVPGQRLIEERLCEETGVSRSPIREAIRRLEKDGLVVVLAQGGVTVYKPTFADFTSLYECRLSLEPAAARYAAQRRTEAELDELQSLMERMNTRDCQESRQIHELNFAFHQKIAEASKNPYLSKIMQEWKVLISFYRNAILQMHPRRPQTVLDEHDRILGAIRRQDGDAAQTSMAEHITQDFQLCMEAYREKSE